MREELQRLLERVRIARQPANTDLCDVLEDVLREMEGLDARYASMWHAHRNVVPYVFQGTWVNCARCGMLYPAGEWHSCPQVRYDPLGRPLADEGGTGNAQR